MTIDQTVGLIAHLPLNAILKGQQGVEFELVSVDLAAAHDAAATLYELTALDLGDKFDTIAAPVTSQTVEQRAGDATHGSEPSPANTPTLDELRAQMRQWSEADKAELGRYFERNDTDRTDAAQVAEAMQAVRNFHDVHAEPVTRPAPKPAPARSARPEPDEGADVGAETVADIGKRYAALDDDVRSWVSVSGAKCRLNPASDGRPTVRRHDILAALITLARGGFDNDDMGRAVADLAIGQPQPLSVPFAELVASLDAAEAARFLEVAHAVVESDVAMRFENDGRPVVSLSAA